MLRNVIRIPETQRIPVKRQQLRVAAYCRVSTKHEGQQQSLDTQICYYTSYIQNHPNWVLPPCILILLLALARINAPATDSL